MQDFKVLLRVNMLQEKNSMSSTLQAMELLKTSPSAAQFATVSLSSQLGLSPQVSKTETQAVERRGR
ncbi:hypothetical protein D3C72_2224660 [compost metagenome]